MNKYILDQLDGEDKVIKFRDLKEIRYPIIVEDIEDMRLGGVELMVYSFLFHYAFVYWDYDVDPSAPAGDVYIIMDLYDFVKVTGCSVQDIRGALICLNEDRWVRVVEVKTDNGKKYAYHAIC